MKNELVELHIENRIAEVILNRPDKRNALNAAMTIGLTNVFNSLADNENVKVVILKAKGDVFSAGADLAYLEQIANNSFEENLADSGALKDLFLAIFNLPKVVIAQVEGHAIAGGCGLASVCDIVFAVPEAKFGYTEVKLGFVPAIVSCFLGPKIGDMLARKLLFTGELFSAHEALAYHLITFVTSATEINQTVYNFATDLCNKASTNSLKETKNLLNFNNYSNLEQKLEQAVVSNATIRGGQDFKKGVGAFLEKKSIIW